MANWYDVKRYVKKKYLIELQDEDESAYQEAMKNANKSQKSRGIAALIIIFIQILWYLYVFSNPSPYPAVMQANLNFVTIVCGLPLLCILCGTSSKKKKALSDFVTYIKFKRGGDTSLLGNTP